MSTPTLPEELWDIERLAEFLGASKRFVYRLTSERRIRYYRVAGSLRFDPDDVA
ncbi:MAG: helix-turn-helix domain-containing protein, partial [Acidimicrobiales bacterium]|nr:helix-turn-helix domain-containing protein [Acidimicrobiales bacterium]